ncbi:D-galactarate dehydratase [Aliiroseovarius sp. S1123]|jgi:hypothetical protein|uniref:D-galactarate dehydratase n=1 Tax=unclassified Aliiroseovarius TaxID=2623558 RepID=UPI001FF1A5E7|nr:D-galactarate dehydratase [Aliiroseovarius sp. S1123]MCK0169996.1 D-galactarate dehydratase [Aliiroseovarius sp. S1123]
MKQVLLISAACLAVTGCAGVDVNTLWPTPPHLRPAAAGPVVNPDAPPADATTADEFDTASEGDKMAALSSTPTPAGALGTTVANLGDPTVPGFWLETPLVTTETEGRVQSKATGRTVKVTLKPTSTGGSRISISALQLLDLDLSGLHELVVFGS